MIREEVITQTIRILQLGEMKYFQIRLPEDTLRIIGIETSYNHFIESTTPPSDFTSGNSASRTEDIAAPYKIDDNLKLGDLYLISTGIEHVFYAETIQEKEYGYGVGDFPGNFMFPSWQGAILGIKREELSVSVFSKTSVIEGWYKDIRTSAEPERLAYRIKIYLWIEKCAS